jgi:DNA-directed RNA polymerase specialized sigma24 family protein
MADTSNGRARRPRRSGEGAALLRQLQDRRASVDEKQADRARREDTALTRFADAAVAIGQAQAEQQRQMVELEKQAEQIRARTTVRVDELAAEQSVALAELAELGRSAEDIAAIVELPVKRVRRLIREAGDREDGPLEESEGHGLVAVEPERSATRSGQPPSISPPAKQPAG